MSTKYRKKPVVIEAVQYRDSMRVSGDLPEGVTICYWSEQPSIEGGDHPTIHTLEGAHIVRDGDWVITGIKGERYPCRDDIFRETYEPVEADEQSP